MKDFFDQHFEDWIEQGFKDEITNYYQYFERTYIGQLTRTGRRSPMFEINIWNHHDRIIHNDFMMTNNGLESYNSSWTPTVPKNASVWTVIESFNKEDSMAKVTRLEDLRGVHQAHNRTRQLNCAARKEELKNICENWSRMEPEQYLEMLANFYKI